MNLLLALVLLSTGMSVAPSAAQDAHPNRILIEYNPPKNSQFQQIYKTVTERHVLEKVQEIFAPFILRNDLTVKIAECGMSNAFYKRPSLTICYEYLEDIRQSIPKGNTPAGLTPLDTVLGQFFYVVNHEMGHAMFDQLDVPLFGRAEDAADGFSAYMMLRLGKEESRRLIGGAAYSYKDYMANPKVTVSTTAFSDAHGAPVQRFYNLLCIAYGADRDSYADLVEKGYLPKSRANNCRMEYGELNFAFQQLIRPHLDPQLAKAVMEKSWLPANDALPARSSDVSEK